MGDLDAGFIYVEANQLDDLLRKVFGALSSSGTPMSSSRGDSLELRNAVLQLTNPRSRLSRSERRGRALSALGEFIWYAAGTDDVGQIEHYIPSYRSKIGGKETAPGAYGPRLFGATSQFETVLRLLRVKTTSRQAVMQIFHADDLLTDLRDVPCTCVLQFFVRNGRVELTTYMRSNDAFLGLPHDVFAFTMLQELMASELGLKLGTYTHLVGSLHVYVRDLPGVKEYLEEGHFEPKEMPEMPTESPLEALNGLVKLEAEIRSGGIGLDGIGAGYWGDLARLLLAQTIARSDDGSYRSSALREVQERLEADYFRIYVSDIQVVTAAGDLSA